MAKYVVVIMAASVAALLAATSLAQSPAALVSSPLVSNPVVLPVSDMGFEPGRPADSISASVQRQVFGDLADRPAGRPMIIPGAQRFAAPASSPPGPLAVGG